MLVEIASSGRSRRLAELIPTIAAPMIANNPMIRFFATDESSSF